MSIMQKLEQVPPRHKAPLGAFNEKYQVTKHYLSDIETARGKGYSWGQIRKAVVLEAKSEGVSDLTGQSWDLGEIFRRIKKASG